MINKIIYFDKETIRNILQEYNKGTKKSTTASNSTASFRTESKVEGTAEIRFQIPLIARIKFLFSGKISANYISMVDSTVTVTSTELSDFEKVRDNFTLFDNKKLMEEYGVHGFPTVFVVDKKSGKKVQLDNYKFFEPTAKDDLVRDAKEFLRPAQ